jgi:hypothetical protein
MAPASTGKLNNRSMAVMNTAHTNRGSLWKFIPGDLMLIMVVMKFMEPSNEEVPAKCKLNMARSTAGVE